MCIRDRSNCGDVNLLTIAELQNMRNGQRDFFSENWVMLVGDNAEQALDWLQIRKYYSDIVELDDLDEVFTWSPEKIDVYKRQFQMRLCSSLLVALAKHILQRFIVVCVPFYIPAQLFVLPRALAHRQLECLRK